jgi:PAS domain S-box-containing protein
MTMRSSDRNWSRTTVMSTFKRYGLATISCGAALGAAWLIDGPSPCFFLAVMVSSLYGGKGPGFLSVGLSTLAFDYFFVPPLFSLHVAQSSSYLRLAVFVGATLFITGLIEAKRRVEAARLEASLRAQKSESYLAEAQRLSQTGSFGWNASTEELFWSEETFRITGYDPGVTPTLELLFDRIHPEDRLSVREELDRTLQSGGNVDFQRRFLMPDGAVKWVHVLAHAVREEDGAVRYIGSVMDITGRVRAEENRRRSQAYLTEAEKLSHAGSWAWDPHRRKTTYWSAEMFRLYRRDPSLGPLSEEELGAIHDPENWARVLVQAEGAVREKLTVDVTCLVSFPDGAHKHIRLVGYPAVNAKGEVTELFGIGLDVTEQHESKVALESALARVQKSETRLRLIIDTIPGLVATMTPSGEVELMNQRLMNYHGKTLEEMKDWLSRVHPEDQALAAERWRRSVETGDPFDVEERSLRADGVYRWFQARGQPLRNADGQIVRWYILLTDIDDRRRAEEALRASEHNFRLIVDSIPGYVTAQRPSGEVELANQPFQAYSGKTADELKDWVQILHPNDREGVISQWRASLEAGDPLDTEVRIRRADGVYRWFHARVDPLRDTQHQIVRWYSLLTDIEDRKNTEEALRRSEQELSLIVETIPALVWCAAPDGALTYVNQRVLEYTGATSDALAQAGWTNFLHSDDLGPTVEAWSRAVATGQQHDFQYRLRWADGEFRWFHVLGQPVRDSEGRITRWYGLLIDIDDRKNIEEALRNTQARLSRATQIATVGELAASIAHEVNQPLAAVVANGHACLRWLSAQPPNLGKAHEAVERIVRDGKDAGEVVRRIRALFKRATAEKTTIELNEIIREVLGLLHNETTRRRVTVEADLEKELTLVAGDRVQLQQLTLNLLLNGIEAMDPVLDRPRKLFVRSKRQNPDNVLVEIRDYGVGLKDPDRVFEAFFTTKENGMGMGLAICRSIVEAHDGRLWAASGEDAGTTFSFTLPLHSDGIQ